MANSSRDCRDSSSKSIMDFIRLSNRNDFNKLRLTTSVDCYMSTGLGGSAFFFYCFVNLTRGEVDSKSEFILIFFTSVGRDASSDTCWTPISKSFSLLVSRPKPGLSLNLTLPSAPVSKI